MLSIGKKNLTFNIKDIHFSDYPYDIEGCDALKLQEMKYKFLDMTTIKRGLK